MKTMKRTRKEKMIAIILTIAMALAFVPTAAFADGESDGGSEPAKTESVSENHSSSGNSGSSGGSSHSSNTAGSSSGNSGSSAGNSSASSSDSSSSGSSDSSSSQKSSSDNGSQTKSESTESKSENTETKKESTETKSENTETKSESTDKTSESGNSEAKDETTAKAGESNGTTEDKTSEAEKKTDENNDATKTNDTSAEKKSVEDTKTEAKTDVKTETPTPAAIKATAANTATTNDTTPQKDELTVHGINILRVANQTPATEPFTKDVTVSKNGTKKESGFLNLFNCPYSFERLGVRYTPLKGMVLTTEESGPVFSDTLDDSQTIAKVSYQGDGTTVVTFRDNSTTTIEGTNEIYVAPVFSQSEIWKLEYNYIDNISTGSGSWNNLNSFSSYSHTFSDPSVKSPSLTDGLYEFVAWSEADNWEDRTEENTYEDGDVFTFTGTGMKAGDTKTIDTYAYWQPVVAINYIDDLGSTIGETLLNKVSSFEEDLNLYDYKAEDKSETIKFAGWYDEEGNRLDEDTTYKLPAITKENNTTNIVTAIARYITKLTVNKIWSDEDDKDQIRPDSVKVQLCKEDGTPIGDPVALSADNEWTYTFEDLDAYANGEAIRYMVSESDIPEGYEFSAEKSEDGTTVTITNSHTPKAEPEPTDPEPTDPTDPVYPPLDPQEPETPDDPDPTVDPQDPETPDDPSTPDKPDTPDKPEKPDTPAKKPAQDKPSGNNGTGNNGTTVNRTNANPGQTTANTLITANETPLTASTDMGTMTTELTDPETPMAAFSGAWALINLIAAVLTAVISVLLLGFWFISRREEREENEAGEEYAAEKTNRKPILRILGIIPAITAIIGFILTEDLTLPMQLVDKYTILMILILAVEIVIACLCKKTRDDEEDEEIQA